jgi:hypothetical protein
VARFMPRRPRDESEPATMHGFLDEIEDKDGSRPRRSKRPREEDEDLDLDRIW